MSKKNFETLEDVPILLPEPQCVLHKDENKWMTSQGVLPVPLDGCIAMLSKDSKHVHIDVPSTNWDSATTYLKVEVRKLLTEEEKMKIEEPLSTEEKNDKRKEGEKEEGEEEEEEEEEDEEEEKKWRNDKKEMVTKFEKLSDDDFEIWLLKQSKWKNDVTKKNIPSICAAIEAFVIYRSADRLAVQVIVDEKPTKIIMRNLTFEELFRQIYNNLEWKCLREMSDKDQKLELADSNDEIIKSDEMVRREFENNEPLFKVLWSPIRIGKIKIIKNALVIMIAINVENFRQLFEQNLGYEFVCNTNFKMNKEDVKEFLIELITSRELVKNKQKYDALIVIVSGHGDKEDVLITSDGKKTQINSIRTLFDCDRMSSFQNFPKIFFID
ncbi:hypothetical protein RFI_24336, partial [Reticulomyxa filosa]